VSIDAADTSHAANASYTADGLLNIPISDTAALRMNASYKDVAGFINASNAAVFNAQQQPALADPANPLTSGFRTQSLRDIDSALSTYFRAALLWHVTPGSTPLSPINARTTTRTHSPGKARAIVYRRGLHPTRSGPSNRRSELAHAVGGCGLRHGDIIDRPMPKTTIRAIMMSRRSCSTTIP